MVAYVHNTVTNQLAAQQIYFPPQASQGAGPDDAPAAPSTWSPNRPRAPRPLSRIVIMTMRLRMPR